MAHLGQGLEELLSLEQLHDQVHGGVGHIDDQLVHLDYIVVMETDDVAELGPQVRQHLLVPREDLLHRKGLAGTAVPAALDQPHSALPYALQLLVTVAEGQV